MERKTTRHRAKAMLPAIQELIAMRSTTNPYRTQDGKVVTDRQIITEKLIDEIRDKFPNETPPAEETLLHRISKARNQTSSPLEKQFTLGCLDTMHEYGIGNISSEAISRILKIQKWLSHKNFSHNVTLRQARWIARLHSHIKDDQELYSASYIYTMHELISEIAKTEFDTSALDGALSKSVNELQDVSLSIQGKDVASSFEALLKIEDDHG